MPIPKLSNRFPNRHQHFCPVCYTRTPGMKLPQRGWWTCKDKDCKKWAVHRCEKHFTEEESLFRQQISATFKREIQQHALKEVLAGGIPRNQANEIVAAVLARYESSSPVHQGFKEAVAEEIKKYHERSGSSSEPSA